MPETVAYFYYKHIDIICNLFFCFLIYEKPEKFVKFYKKSREEAKKM